MKNYLFVVAFLAFFSIQALAQKSPKEKATYEVYNWALANIKNWEKLENTNPAPQEPIFFASSHVDTIITFDPVTFVETVEIVENPPTDPAEHTKAMKRYEEEKQQWTNETEGGQLKTVYLKNTDYQMFQEPGPQFSDLFKSVKTDMGSDVVKSLDFSKLIVPSGKKFKYRHSPKGLEPYIADGMLGLSEVFFNLSFTAAIITIEESTYDGGRRRKFSSYLLVKKNDKWEMAKLLGRKEE